MAWFVVSPSITGAASVPGTATKTSPVRGTGSWRQADVTTENCCSVAPVVPSDGTPVSFTVARHQEPAGKARVESGVSTSTLSAGGGPSSFTMTGTGATDSPTSRFTAGSGAANSP